MFFLFEDKDGELYDNPDSYVLSLPGSRVTWGTELKICPVYVKGGPVYHGRQTIQVMFYHEGSTGSADDIYWVSKSKTGTSWYELITHNEKISVITSGNVINFDLGDRHPKYFYSARDLAWYIGNIYPLDRIYITDENSLGETI
jgi:hypothetical protein